MEIATAKTMDELTARLRRFTVDEYYRMASAGILGEDDRVELLDGQIVTMPPIGSPHGGIVNRLTRLLIRRLGDRAVVAVQNPVRLDVLSEPQPDFGILHARADDYAEAHARPHEIHVLVEVADSTLTFDRGYKLRLYAKAGVPEVWIVDVQSERVEIYRDPVDQRYTSVHVADKSDSIAPAAFPDAAIHVGELFG